MGNFLAARNLGLVMSHQLGQTLRELRQQRGYSQARMGELLGLTANGYQRIESGHQNHHADTLERIDAGMIAAGFDWSAGLAAELDHVAAIPLSVLERLDRIEATLEAKRACCASGSKRARRRGYAT